MSNESKDPRDSDTVRDLPKQRHVVRDTVPEQMGVYVAPRPLAPTSEHRTIQIKPVVLASHVDPRRAPTELRLSAPPPPRRRSGWLIPLALLAIAFGAIVALRFTEPPPRAGTPAISGPKSDVPVEPRPLATSPGTATALNPPAGSVAAPPPEVELRSSPSAAPAPSAAPKKKRDPWLE